MSAAAMGSAHGEEDVDIDNADIDIEHTPEEEAEEHSEHSDDMHADGDGDGDGDAAEAAAEAGSEAEGANGEGEAAEGGTASAATGGVTPLKRPAGAYFLFLNAHRPLVISEFEASHAAAVAEAEAAGTEAPKSRARNVAAVGKRLGEIWKAMSEEEKAPFVTAAAAQKAAYESAIAADPSLKPATARKAPTHSRIGEQAAATDFVLPLGRIKKIIDLDPEKKKVAKEALWITEKATEHFIGWLASRAHLTATARGRKGLKGADVAHIVTANSRLTFLRAPLKRALEQLVQADAAATEARVARLEDMRRKRQKRDEGAEGETGEAEADGTAAPHEGEMEAEAAAEGAEDEGGHGDARPKAKGSAASKGARGGKGKPPAASPRKISSMFARA